MIGTRARWIAAEARSCGLDPAAVLELENNQAAAAYLAKNLQAKDVVLIKGSNSQRLDEIILALTSVDHETPNVAR